MADQPTVITPQQAEELKITLNPWAALDQKYAGVTPPVGTSATPLKARHIVFAVGTGFTNEELITDVLTAIKAEDPNTVIVSQNRFQPDKLAVDVARTLGLRAVAVKPKFLFDQNIRRMLAGRAMTEQEQAQFGYSELTDRWSKQADELHVFGTQQGPQLGWIRAFMLAGKNVIEWMNPEQQAFRRQRDAAEIPMAYSVG